MRRLSLFRGSNARNGRLVGFTSPSQLPFSPPTTHFDSSLPFLLSSLPNLHSTYETLVASPSLPLFPSPFHLPLESALSDTFPVRLPPSFFSPSLPPKLSQSQADWIGPNNPPNEKNFPFSALVIFQSKLSDRKSTRQSPRSLI